VYKVRLVHKEQQVHKVQLEYKELLVLRDQRDQQVLRVTKEI
jgi:hypothetical protein